MNALPPLRITTAAPVGIAYGAIKNGSLPSARDGSPPFLIAAGLVANRRIRRFISTEEFCSDPVNHGLWKLAMRRPERFRAVASEPLSSLLEEDRMFRGVEMKMNERIKNAGIAQALTDLIAKNRAQAAELEALARLVQSEIAAGQQREAERTARLGEALGELAEAKAAVEIEKQARIEAEEFATGLAAAVDTIQGALARLPSARQPALPDIREEAADPDRLTAFEDSATRSTPLTETAPGGGSLDSGVAKSDGQCLDLSGAEPRTVSIAVNLTAAEAVALETLAARTGAGGSADAAARLIHDGLRRTGWTPTADENPPQRE